MDKFIPFIHKIKKENKQEQLPLYIEMPRYEHIIKPKEDEDNERVIIIQL